MAGKNPGDRQVVWRPECFLLWTRLLERGLSNLLASSPVVQLRDAACMFPSHNASFLCFQAGWETRSSPLMDKQWEACQALGETP